MNAIQSLGKSVIVQPKPTGNDSTGFSTLLSTLGIKMIDQEAGRTEGKSEVEQSDESELPLNLLMINKAALPLDVQVAQTSSSPKLQGNLENNEMPQVKSGSQQQGLTLPGFTKQELESLAQVGKQAPLESEASKLSLSNESKVQLHEKNAFHKGDEILTGFLKQEWLNNPQGVKEVLAVIEEKPVEEARVVEVPRGQEATKSLEVIKQMTAEQSSQQKNLDVTVNQPPRLEEQEAIVEDREQRFVLEGGKEFKSQVDQAEDTEQLDQPSTETLPVDDVQSDEKPDGLPLVKQSNDAPVKEATVQARYMNTELSEMLTERMQLSKNGDETNIRIKLSPENLGQLDIRLTTSDGKVTAHILTATSGAKELIESQLHQLRHTLVQQGIQLDKVEVVQHQGSQHSFMQDGRGEQKQQFQQGKQHQGRKGEYDLEENPLVTNEREESISGGINYAI